MLRPDKREMPLCRLKKENPWNCGKVFHGFFVFTPGAEAEGE